MNQPKEVFSVKPISAPLTLDSYRLDCECGQNVFEVTGYGLQVKIQEGMDIIGKCRCGREHSMITQMNEVAEYRKAQAAANVPTPPAPPAEAPTAAPTPEAAPEPNPAPITESIPVE